MTSPGLLLPRHRHARSKRRHDHLPLRDHAATAAACLALAAVIPLALSQIPNGLAWSLGHLPASSAESQIAVLRACGLALPAMMAAAPCAAVAVRRIGAGWPVLLAGLALLAMADLTTGVTRGTDPGHMLVFIAANRALHGVGAGMALPAAATLAGTRPLPRIVWSIVTAAALAAAPLLIRSRLTSAGTDWLTALRPFPWLAALALGAVAVWMPLAGHTRWWRGARREDAGERDRLVLVAAPLTALALMMVAVSFRTVGAVVATAISAVVVVVVLTAILARDTGRAFPCACALAGFTVMPAASLLSGAAALTPAMRTCAGVGIAAVFAALLARTGSRPQPGGVAVVMNATVLMIGAAGAGYLAVGAMMVHG